jgi:DNA segregation ATPase FtsK/SpoIIIE, S-DNA-T family
MLAVSFAMDFSFPGSDLFLFPGRFLFQAFSWAAFYIPVYLFVTAIILVRFTLRRIIILFLTLLPFLTLTLVFKTVLGGDAGSSVIDGLRAFLGPAGSTLGLGAYTLVEIALIVMVARMTGAKARARAIAERDRLMAAQTAAVRRAPLTRTSAPKIEPAKNPGPMNRVKPDVPEAPGGGNGNGRGLSRAISIPEPVWDDVDDDPVDEAMAQSAAEYAAAEKAGAEDDDQALAGRDDKTPPARRLPAASARAGAGRESVVRERQPKSRGRYRILPGDVLRDYGREDYNKLDAVTQRLAETLRLTLEEFNIQAEVTGIQKGPVITMFEMLPAPGVKLSKIVNLADNIALRLAASRVRIVAPIPGKQAVGIEVPNKKRAIVSLKETISGPEFQESERGLPIALGKDIMGNVQIADLTQMPHLLIAGATGSGKSVCVNSIICSLLLKKSPAEVRLILIDPKIVELKFYNDIPHLLTPVITEPKKAFQALQYCIAEMERRYALLDALCVRDITAFNVKAAKKTHTTDQLPHIVVVIDEFADLIAVTGKDLESTLARLAAMSRAVGIHIVLATQRPSIDVITGLIKANIPSRIAFMVAGKFDSRIIIDQVGAEKLLGQGDMLFCSSQDPFPVRIQGAYISDREVEDLVARVKTFGEPDYIDDEIFIEEESDFDIGLGEADPMFDKALEVVMAAGKASTSYVQRKLKIGYNRAARLVEEMEIRGIVGPANGSKAREIIHVPSRPRE